MTAQDLKNSILQLAVEGKLLSRKEVAEALETTEGPKTGAELLEQIKAEKARLIAEGKIKKDTTKAGASGRALAEITEDEKPFDIPENWCWCRLGEICSILGDGIHGTPQYDPSGDFYFVNGNNLVDGKIVIKPDTKKVNKEEFEKYKKQLNENTMLVSINGTIGNIGFYNDEKIILGKSACYFNLLNKDFKDLFFFFFQTDYFLKYALEEATGTTIKNVSLAAMRNFKIPLPPLAEQKAIVAKIEELLPYIQKYDTAHTKLEEFNKKFPVDMQKSILQQAIMGKLTEDWRNEQARLAKTNSAVQLDDCSSAKDLLKKIKAQKARLIAEGKIKKDTTKAGTSGRALAEITEDEIPFDIPESWCWCRLGDICFDIKRGKSPKYVEKSNYLAFAQKCNVKTGGINLEIALYLDESTISRYSNTDCLVQGDVVINSTGGGTMGRVGYFECEIPKGIKGIYPDSHVTTIRTVGFMEQKFVFYFLKTKQKELESLGEGSTNQTELKPYTLQNLLLPLPPLAEQKRIVAKIEELLPLCKKLVK
ncbi:restriction endonuclease subunit S [Treponema sp.]|uniref:restriction endonuclease subunit S n=1 Tax=Treponema sp. TaxID=166 RepID=UPI003FD8E118